MTKKYGLAVDIGTTTITAGLLDLVSKKETASLVDFNPQARFGQDVVSRLGYCIKNKNGLQELHNAVIKSVNKLTERLLKESRLSKRDLGKMVVVGNTAMEHFFLKIPAASLAEAPYVSGLPEGVIETKNIFLLPVIKSFVGSDLTAGILYTKLTAKKGTNLLIDIGTNGEMALSCSGKLFVTSTAAGPAFEISDKGILGTEIIDIISSLLSGGDIDKTGKLKIENKRITQGDIRRIQVAKAAIMAGMLALVNKASLKFDDVDNLYVSGKFGSLINKDAAVKIGLLPDIDKSKIKFIGNSAYKGALLALCSESAMKKTETIARKAIHLSLFGRRDFQDEFVKNMRF
jgi:uncharacterized 2Fe-2S/4Fe-4S cluster protein (DUF4445 family)